MCSVIWAAGRCAVQQLPGLGGCAQRSAHSEMLAGSYCKRAPVAGFMRHSRICSLAVWPLPFPLPRGKGILDKMYFLSI